MGGCAQVIHKHYDISHKGLEYLQVWVSAYRGVQMLQEEKPVLQLKKKVVKNKMRGSNLDVHRQMNG